MSLSLLQHVAAILGSRSSRCSRLSYRFSLTACYHLRLRPNSVLITQKPNIPEVFRGTSQKGDCPGICPGRTRISLNGHPTWGHTPKHSPSVTAARCCWRPHANGPQSGPQPLGLTAVSHPQVAQAVRAGRVLLASPPPCSIQVECARLCLHMDHSPCYSAYVCSLSRSSAFLHLVLQDLEPMGMRPATPLHSTKSINQSRRYKDSHSSCDGEASCLLS